jgi:integrase
VGVAEELVAAEVFQALRTVPGLRQGRTNARETDPIKPVADVLVDPVLPVVSAEVCAMIELQRLTGMRSGEVTIMWAADIDMAGQIWIYRPPHHKLAYKNKPRAVAIGPRGQEIIKPFLQLSTEAYLFSPARAEERRLAKLRAGRKTRVQPSQQNRRKRKTTKQAGEHYDSGSYGQAIKKACAVAFPAPEPLAKRDGETIAQWRARLTDEQKAELKAWDRAHSWHPHQLRHSHATEVRRQFGLEAAQCVLGHANASITELYAEKNLTLAATVAAKIG